MAVIRHLAGAIALLLASHAQAGTTVEPDTDRWGSDYASSDLQTADPELCRKACEADSACKAYTYVRPGVQARSARCYLKNTVPEAKPDTCCVSGVKVSDSISRKSPNPAPPPTTPPAKPKAGTAQTAVGAILGAAAAAGLKLKPVYQSPLSGDDLAPQEYVSTTRHWTDDGKAPSGVQDDGFDFGVRQWRDGAFSGVKAGTTGAANSDHLIYGKPVYAMADGVVVGCWRNAEENPSPGPHHSQIAQGFIAGGGNHIWITHPDGATSLYAHFIPGSMPAAICPHNDVFFKNNDGGHGPGGPVPDVGKEVAVANGAAVKKGQFLGLAGNSGSSGGPHLHVHLEKDGLPIPIDFDRVLTAEAQADEAALQWAPLRAKPLPTKMGQDLLVWPARSADKPFSRSGVPSSHAAALAQHLENSGLWPGVVTCDPKGSSSVAYNFENWVKAPPKSKWAAHFNLDVNALQTAVANAQKEGFRVDSVSTCKMGQGLLSMTVSAAIFKKP